MSLQIGMLLGAFAVAGCSSAPQSPGTVLAAKNGVELVREMGVGFNLGNTFDLKSNPPTLEDAKKVIDLYRSAGAKHIRIPITWMDAYDGDHLADKTGKLNSNHPRLTELKKIVDYSVKAKLFVILNTHHEGWLKHGYDGSERLNGAFRNLWTGIANEFKSQPTSVVFEVLNEPEGTMGQWGGKVQPYDPQAIAYTRQINEVGYQAIRATGGNNSKRLILIMPNGQGNHNMLQPNYPDKSFLPGKGADAFLAVSVHTYDPWPFCGQDGKNANWPGEAAIVDPIKKVMSHAKALGVGIHYGEFGVGRESDQSLRNTPEAKSVYRAVKTTVIGGGGSVTPWDDRGWFGMIEKDGNGYRFKFDLFPSMME